MNDTNGEEKNIRKKKDKNLSAIRERVALMYNKCPESMLEDKDVLRRCNRYYQSFSLMNNINRMCLFFRYNKRIMAYKRRSLVRRWLYCIKMFFTIQ